jgi:hypothetical protein
MNPAPPVTRKRLLINVQRTRNSFNLRFDGFWPLSEWMPVPPQPMVSIQHAGPQLSGNLMMGRVFRALAPPYRAHVHCAVSSTTDSTGRAKRAPNRRSRSSMGRSQ